MMLPTLVKYWRRPRRHANPLEAVVPGLTTHTFTDRAGNGIGLVRDGAHWIAVLRIDSPTPSTLPALFSELAKTLAGGVRVAATQLVRWTVPKPAETGSWDVHWVAVRFDPATDPAAVAARGGGQAGAIQATAVAALRLSFQLRRHGFTVQPVQERELRSELACSLGPGGSSARESWRAWSVGTLHHTALRVAPADPVRVLAWHARPPALSTTSAILLSATDRGPRLTATLRIAVPADRGGRSVRSALGQAMRGVAAGAKRMNGLQCAGVRATLPLGQ